MRDLLGRKPMTSEERQAVFQRLKKQLSGRTSEDQASLTKQSKKPFKKLCSKLLSSEYLSYNPLLLYGVKVSAGTPSPLENYIEEEVDLNHHLAPHPNSTFLVRVEGDSMIGAQIFENDILVVDRSIKPTHGKIVVAMVNGEFTIKRLKMASNHIWLVPENPHYTPLKITEEMDFKVWGVVLHSIRSF